MKIDYLLEKNNLVIKQAVILAEDLERDWEKGL